MRELNITLCMLLVIVTLWSARLSTEKDPEQTGPLITPAVLPALTPQQMQALQMAKKYCQDVSAKHVSNTEYSALHVSELVRSYWQVLLVSVHV